MTSPRRLPPEMPATARPGPVQPGAWLTVEEVATWLRVSKMTVYRLTKSGALPAKRIGRSLRIHQSAVARYLNDADAADGAA